MFLSRLHTEAQSWLLTAPTWRQKYMTSLPNVLPWNRKFCLGFIQRLLTQTTSCQWFSKARASGTSWLSGLTSQQKLLLLSSLLVFASDEGSFESDWVINHLRSLNLNIKEVLVWIRHHNYQYTFLFLSELQKIPSHLSESGASKHPGLQSLIWSIYRDLPKQAPHASLSKKLSPF